MGRKAAVAFLVFFISIVFLFQNCSGAADGNGAASSQGRVATEIDFKKGDPFDPAVIPYTVTDQDLLDRFSQYVDDYREGLLRSIAFAPDGQGVAAWIRQDLVVDQLEWDRVVLERCEMKSRQPCSLFASGAELAQDRDEFYLNHNFIIDTPDVFDGTKLPGVIDHWRNYNAANYAPIPEGRFRAYAVGDFGNTHTGWSDSSQQEANRRAIEFCEALTLDSPCALYAQGLDVVFDLFTYTMVPRSVLFEPHSFDPMATPFLSDSARASLQADYNESVENNLNFIVAVDRFGSYYFLATNEPLNEVHRATVRFECKQLFTVDPGGFDRECVIYAENDQVVWDFDTFRQRALGY